MNVDNAGERFIGSAHDGGTKARAVRQPRLTYPWPRPPVHADYDRTAGLSWAGQGSGIRRCTMMSLGWNGCAAEVRTISQC